MKRPILLVISKSCWFQIENLKLKLTQGDRQSHELLMRFRLKNGLILKSGRLNLRGFISFEINNQFPRGKDVNHILNFSTIKDHSQLFCYLFHFTFLLRFKLSIYPFLSPLFRSISEQCVEQYFMIANRPRVPTGQFEDLAPNNVILIITF